jgi:hypothetical protein
MNWHDALASVQHVQALHPSQGQKEAKKIFGQHHCFGKWHRTQASLNR